MKKITLLLMTLMAFTWQSKAQYCTSNPSSNDGTGISNLQVGATNFTSGGDITYEDFTGAAVDIQAGATANVQITFTTGWTYNTHVWIDFEDDGSFIEAGNLVYSGESLGTNPTTLNASFLVDASAALGTHRMRIGTADSGQSTPNPCYSSSYGVTMDVDINIIAAPSCLPPSALVVANEGITSADLSWTENGTASLYNVEVVASGDTPTGTATDTGVANPFTKTGLTSNTTYDFYVQTDCTGGDLSGWVGPFSFVTPPSCLAPSTLAVSNISATSADVAWTAGDTETLWNIEVVDITASGTVTGTATSTGVTNPYSLTTLTANTSYEFYVQADCTGGDVSAWVGPFAFTTPCEAIAIPFTEGFNSDSSTQNCWTVLNENADGDSWDMVSTYDPFEGDEGVEMYTDYNGGNNDDWLISPGLILTGNERLKFQSRVRSSSEPNNFEVRLSTTGVAPADFTNVIMADADYSNTTYVEYVVNLSAYSGTSYIAFHIPAGGLDGYYLYIDDVIVETLPSCLAPSALAVSNISATSADVAWTAGDTETLWNIEVVDITASGTVTGTATSTGVTNPYSLTTLTANTSYEFYVQADCTGGDVSAWVGPFAFTTLCEAFTVPYTENFDSTAVGSSTNPTVPNCWSFIDGGAGYVYVNSTGANSFYIYNSYDASGNYILVGPSTTDLASGSNRVSFDVDGSISQDLIIGTMSDATNAATFTAIQTITLATSNYESYTVNIPVGTDMHIAFKHGQTGTYDSYYLDNIVVEAIPSCVEPSALSVSNISSTTADVAWTENGTASLYNVEVVASGGTPTGTATDAGVANPFTKTGLALGTNYDFYVQTDCTGGDVSPWTGPFQFKTYGDCSSSGTFDYITNSSLASSLQSFAANTPGDYITLTFSAGSTESGYDDWFINDAADGTGATIATGDGSIVGTYESVTGEISFYVESDGSTNGNSFVYTLSCAAPPACADPIALTATNITSSSADVAWAAGGTETIWNIEVVDITALGTVTGTATTTSVTNPYTLTGLMAENDYEFYVQADCTGGDVSAWTGPFAFTTTCDAITAFPYTQDFDGAWDCWSVNNNDGGATWSAASTYITAHSGANTAHGMGNSDDYLILPQFTFVDGMRLKWWDVVEGASYNNTYDVLLSTTGFAPSDFTVNLGTIDCTNTSWQQHVISLSAYTGNVYIAFHQTYSAATNWGFGIDDVTVDADPALGVNTIENNAFTYFPNPVNDKLILKAQNDIQNVVVYNMLGQEVLRTAPNTLESNMDMSELNSGTYFVQVTINQATETIKIIKQ